MKASRPPLLALGALFAASLACTPARSGRDIPATVNAVSTQVQQTLAAQTPALAATNPAASPQPTAPPPQTTAAQPSPAPTSAHPPSPPTPLPSPTLGLVARPNGTPIHAPRLFTRPQIDGDLSEWSLIYSIDHPVFQPANWSGAADQSATFTVAWDDTYLYLAAHVVDDVHVQTQTGRTLYQGDSLEILLDADLAGDFSDTSLNDDDFQLGLSPGALVADEPDAYLWFPAQWAARPAGVLLAARRSGGGEGYLLEAAIPWLLFGIEPKPGDRFGFAVSSSDNDSPETADQQSMISTAPTRRLTNPTTWGTLVLDD
jgi:hypothetical protein